MAEQFPDLPWINRGFGGGRTWECLYFFDEIVAPYKPRLIVYFCGTNDTVDPKRTPESTVSNTKAFLDLVRTKLPGTRVLYLSLTKAPSRRNVWDKMDAVNRDMADVIKADPAAAWFDMNSLVFDEKGEPRMDLYREDQLHLNAAGYAALSNAIRPLIDEQLKKTE
jgi:lysophospholipase L1-like esterase